MLSLAMAARLATDPALVRATAIRPGTPQEPPRSQGRLPGGLEMAVAMVVPTGEAVVWAELVRMRKKLPPSLPVVDSAWASFVAADRPSPAARDVVRKSRRRID